MPKYSYTDTHAMYESVKYEDIVLGKEYAITLAPMDQKEDLVDPIRGFFKATKEKMMECRSLEYKLHFEFSPLGIKHWHGMIRIFDKKEWMLNDIRRLKRFGHVCVRKIDDIAKWVAYCEKQDGESIEHINWKDVDWHPDNIVIAG